MKRRLVIGLLAAGLLLAACSGGDDGGSASTAEPSTTTTLATTVPPTTRSGPARQPTQPTSGPGGRDYPYGDWAVSEGGTGNDAWYLFEPTDPRPTSAPVAIVLHGYFEYEGYDQMAAFIRHTVRTGTIVIYPRWQTGVADPCPGPYDIEPCLTAATNAIHRALAELTADPTRVQPETDQASWFGFSFGGIVATDLANRYEELDLPEPSVLFLDDPHDGGFTGNDEPALDDSLAGIPSTTLVECHSGAEGVIAGPGAASASCNSLFPLLDHIPAENKSLVLTEPDRHGRPALSSGHGVCAADLDQADAYDWGFCWKVWDALRSAAVDGTGREYALGDTPEHRSNGTWTDGTPIAPLVVRDEAPIAP